MGLYACQECQRDVSDRAEACQHCGCPTASKGVWKSLSELNAPTTYIFLLIIFLVLFVLINPEYFFSKDGSNVSEKLSHLGGFFGGLLSPLLTFISVILLITTLKLTRDSVDISKRELTLSRQAMADSAIALKDQASSLDTQNFNNIFFHLLTYHQAIAASSKVSFWGYGEGALWVHRELTGVECFSFLNKKISEELDKNQKSKLSLSDSIDDVDVFNKVMNEFGEKYSNNLEHYMMSIESILITIDESTLDIKKSLYINILSSQLALPEFFMVFYIGASPEYGNESSLKKLLVKYNFFGSLNVYSDSMDAFVMSLYNNR